jgi:DNA-binding CsgD family transcriptional regulator
MGADTFVGREPELARLRDEWRVASAGSPRFVVVDGEAGIGKTALLARFGSQLQGGRILLAAGDADERDVPFAVVDQLGRQVDGPPRAWQLTSEPHRRTADPIAVGAALIGVLSDLQATGPVALVIDDAHWADIASLQALGFALRRLVADRVLAVVCVRTEETAGLPSWVPRLRDQRGARIHLEGLSEPELRALAVAIGAGELRPHDSSVLRSNSGGNPLYATAVLQEISREALGDQSGAPLPAPSSYRELIVAQLGACAGPPRDLLEAAAVLGMSCPLATAAVLAGVADGFAALDRALTAGLLHADGSGPTSVVWFPHPVTRSAVYHGIQPGHRAELHRRAANLVDDATARWRHLVLGSIGPDQGLATELEGFARRAAVSGAWVSAGWAMLAAADLSPARRDRERHTLEAIQYAITAGDGGTVMRLAPRLGEFEDTAYRRCGLGAIALISGHMTEAEALLRSAWDALGETGPDPALAATIEGWLCALLVNAGRASEGLDWARDLTSRAVKGEQGLTNVPIAVIAAAAVGYTGAVQTLASLPLLPEGDDISPLSTDLLTGRGVVGVWTEDLPNAERDLRRVMAVARANGPFVDFLIALFYLSDVYYRLGRWDDAITLGELAASASEDSDQAWVLGLVHGVAAFPLAGRGAWELAERHALAARAASEQIGDLASVWWAAMAGGRLAHARRDFPGVVSAFDPLLAWPHTTDGLWNSGVQPWEALYAEALVNLGRLGDAESVLGGLESRLAQCPPSARADAARVRGMLDAAGGHDESASGAFMTGVDLATGLGQPFLEARNQLACGEFLRRRGERKAALEHLTRAQTLFHDLGAAPYTEHVEQELRACGLQPRIRTYSEASALTPQELAVANLVCKGMTNRDVATELFISGKTVEAHLGSIYAKVGVHSRTQLTLKLLQQRPAIA